MLVETEDEQSQRLADEAKEPDEYSSDDNEEQLNHEVAASVLVEQAAEAAPTEEDYNPNILPPSFSDQLVAERVMRMYGHKPYYAPINTHDAERRDTILKRYRDDDTCWLTHEVIRKEFIASLPICQPDMYKAYQAACEFTGGR